MKTYDILNALGELEDDTLLNAHELPAKPVSVRRRIPAGALIAAVLAVLLSLGAVAYAIAHVNTVRLMHAGPSTGGREAVSIDETAQQLIDNESVDYGISQTSQGTTVTLDSVMGFTDETKSLLYITLTVTPPEGFAFPDDMTDWGFWGNFHLDADVSGSGSEVAVKNDDGTASCMLMWISNANLSAKNAALKLGGLDSGGFGNISKENARLLNDGIRQIELPGNWEFDLGRIELPPTQEIALNEDVLSAAGLPLKSLHLTSFGGIALMGSPHVQDAMVARLWASFPEELCALFPAVDWAALTDEDFEALWDSDDTTDDQRLRLMDLMALLPPVDYGGPETFTLEYPDGSSYTVEAPNNLWVDFEENGDLSFTVLFLSPQPISRASAIVINDIRIPLK